MAGRTDAGRMRANNEDAFAIAPAFGLAVLSDGMGGHLAGEVASGMAVDLIRHHVFDCLLRAPKGKQHPETGRYQETECLAQALDIANHAIFELSHGRPEYEGMGATVVVAVFFDDKLGVAHVGDSRVYRLRHGQLQQLTVDHSVVQEMLDRGLISAEDARLSYNKNIITRALGTQREVAPDVREEPVEAGDVYLLCSDGLTDVLSDADIAAIIAAHDDLQTAVDRLVDAANERGGPDNITVVLVRSGQRFVRNKKTMKQQAS